MYWQGGEEKQLGLSLLLSLAALISWDPFVDWSKAENV